MSFLDDIGLGDVVDAIAQKNGLDSAGGIAQATDNVFKALTGGGPSPKPMPNPATAGQAGAAAAPTSPASIAKVGSAWVKAHALWVGAGLVALAGLWYLMHGKGGRR